MLDITDLTYRYGDTLALDGVDLAVEPGRCVALLGPNGAGKSTLIALATGRLTPQGDGRVRIGGRDPRSAATRRRLGVVQQTVGFPRTLRVGELVRGAAVRAGVPAASAGPVLAEVGLTELTRRRSGKLSGGQQQRLQLAMGLVADPGLLLLDEPTAGLDVTARRRFWETLRARRERGTAIVVTTHLIEEAAAVADQVVLLHRGQVVATGHPDELTERLPDRTIRARTTVTPGDIADLEGVLATSTADGRLRIATRQPEPVVRRLLDLDPELSDLRIEGASLEEALVEMTDQLDREATEVAA